MKRGATREEERGIGGKIVKHKSI